MCASFSAFYAFKSRWVWDVLIFLFKIHPLLDLVLDLEKFQIYVSMSLYSYQMCGRSFGWIQALPRAAMTGQFWKSVQADVFRRKLPENLSLFAQIDSNQMSECYEWQKIGDRDSAASSLTFLFFIFEIVFRIAKERIKTRFRSGKYRTSYDRKRYPSKLQRSLDGSLT